MSLAVVISCQEGKFTSINGEEKQLSSLIGMKVFDVIYNESKANPETLTGTNNNRWVIYLDDINITLETDKSTDTVKKASLGKKPKKSTWAN